ncbi:MAG: DUF192 domain-containing protein [Burkholderiales bacterium]|jgi:uncharacterized membrane protein (UPF0127 family)|nr:DUF192 domain-containing protein [Burkholderiales bacterium]
MRPQSQRSPASAARHSRYFVLSGALAISLVVGVVTTVTSAPATAQPTTTAAQGTPQLNLPRVRLTAGMHLIDAQVARTPDQQATGLMFRQDMPINEGMLFVFDQPRQQCFWMKNTLIPLTAAFVDDDGTIVNLADMQPLSTASHCSTRPVRYVLEMNQGWFARKGLKAGFRLGGEPFTIRR